MTERFGIYHEFDYGERHLERGEYVEIEVGMMKNDQSLINIGYMKPHDGKNLTPCLRCGKNFVSNAFIRSHEENCPIEPGVEIPSDNSKELTLAEIRQRTLAQAQVVNTGS